MRAFFGVIVGCDDTTSGRGLFTAGFTNDTLISVHAPPLRRVIASGILPASSQVIAADVPPVFTPMAWSGSPGSEPPESERAHPKCSPTLLPTSGYRVKDGGIYQGLKFQMCAGGCCTPC